MNQSLENDRYLSFIGLNCDQRAVRFIGDLRELMREPDRTDPFWTYLAAKLDGERGPAHDELYHIHCHLNDIRDLLDRLGAPELIAELDVLETECC
ncbi:MULTISPECIES: N(2)-fixation sustaining protein CowN [unclassified Thiocapsa]|uniref:N(2)-fixation sustaining protein CowN n=1 Tax=unclassified Thiocapsa TaxID=2641286 RepID=UPI0035B0F26B